MQNDRQKKFIVGMIALCLPVLVNAATVYETHAEFLNRAFSNLPPQPGIVWLSGERTSTVGELLGHDYPALRLRYWCQAVRSAGVLAEVGKEQPITVGVGVVVSETVAAGASGVSPAG